MHPISVCIIAKNEEKRIGKCLASLKPYGFEIVVVDTGSTDATKEIASGYADKVLDFAWCDDFSAARNFSLQAASNNWIFMMDCDEWIKTIDVEELNYFRKHYADSVGAISRENLVTVDGQPTLNNTDRTERFFDRRLYHYTGIIHEQLAPIRGKELPCLLLHTTIEHSGYDMTPEEQEKKSRRNITLLQKQLEADPENPYVYYQLGKGYEIVEDYESACRYYGEGLKFDLDPELAYVQAMVVSYGNALLRTEQEETALGYEQIYDTFAVSADFVYLMGRIYMANERYPQAVEQFVKATTMKNCNFHGANSFLAYYHIGLICEKLGDTDNALAYYKKCGDYGPALQKMTQMSLNENGGGKSSGRLVLFENDNFILQYIAGQYRQAFLKMGYEVFVFPSVATQEEFQQNAEQMFLFREKGLDAVITFNNRGACLRLNNGTCLWDMWKVPCYNILVDHPMNYFDTLDENPEYGVVVCADRNHVDYVRRFYPKVSKAFFLPTAGEELANRADVTGMEKKPMAERTIDVLFVGSYKYHSECNYDSLDEKVMDYLITHPETTFEKAVEVCLKDVQPELTDETLKTMIEKHRFTDVNLSAMYRLEILRVLVKNGITVTVYGNGWESTELYGNLHFICHPPISFEEGLALMGESKIVLNQLAWFKDGASERIFNAMLQGAVSVTDDSIYLREILKDGENVVFYSLAELEKLPDIVSGLLGNPDRMQQIADAGYQTAHDGHTWEQRARQLSELLVNNV